MFQAPIRTEDRAAAWEWNPAWGAQPADQHVRARLMADDAAVLSQMQGSYLEQACINEGGY